MQAQQSNALEQLFVDDEREGEQLVQPLVERRQAVGPGPRAPQLSLLACQE